MKDQQGKRAIFLSSNLTCSERKDCKECVQSLECVYCETQSTCVDGNVFGPSNKTDCTNWRYKQCKFNQKLVYVRTEFKIFAKMDFIQLL